MEKINKKTGSMLFTRLFEEEVAKAMAQGLTREQAYAYVCNNMPAARNSGGSLSEKFKEAKDEQAQGPSNE